MKSSPRILAFSADHEKPEDACENLTGRAWRYLNSSSPNLDTETFEHCKSINVTDAINFFKSLSPDFVVLRDLANDDNEVAGCFRMKLLQLTLTNSKHHEFKLQKDLGLLNCQDRFCDNSRLDILPFQESLLRFGKVLITCPFDGASKASDQSFFVQAKGLMYNYLLYRFVHGNHAYFLIAGGVSGHKIGLFFPSKNLIITSSPSLESAFRCSLSVFCAKVIVNSVDFLEYLQYSQKKEPCLCLFYSKQFAHSILADLSGFYASLYILLASKDFFYMIGDNLLLNPSSIFHFVDSSKLSYEDCDQAFIRSLRQKNLLIRVTRNNKVSNDFESYIRSVSIFQLDKNVKTILVDFVGRQLIIHHVLRKNRTWDCGVEGIIYVFLELRKIYPNSILILDGPTSFYNAQGEKVVNTYSESNLAKKIQESLPRGSCVSIIGMSFPEKVIIVNEASFTIGPYGAGTILNLVLRTPCILWASKVSFPGDFLTKWWIGFRPDLSVLPRLIFDSDPLLDSGNFSIDRQVVLNACLEMANELWSPEQSQT